ncbi:MAG: hypothetical protein CM15mP103_06930 [Gammaproteobacteria bacterium]|nr:MAG: hypothetical protein CM15mP103_06930 [Gammaproteobacteria bacterium]
MTSLGHRGHRGIAGLARPGMIIEFVGEETITVARHL